MLDSDFLALEQKAGEIATLLRALGNDKRLMILCKLAGRGEMNVTTLAGEVGLSQSALSQHLARMRAENIVTTRRDSQTIWYRIGDDRTERLMTILHEVFCQEDE